jgi:hypothetical protein
MPLGFGGSEPQVIMPPHDNDQIIRRLAHHENHERELCHVPAAEDRALVMPKHELLIDKRARMS